MFMSRFRIIFLLSMLTVLAISGCGEVKKEDKEITVMTYNVYFGGDTGSVFALTNRKKSPYKLPNCMRSSRPLLLSNALNQLPDS